MTEASVLDFTSGATTAEQFAKDEKAARDAARGRTKYFSLKNDGEVAIVRFLFEANQMGLDRSQPIGPNNPPDPTTGWIMTKQHSFVDTKPAPKDKPEGTEWQDSVGAICRKTPIGADKHPAYPTCYICDNIKNDRGKLHIPSVQMWAGAVLREELIGTQELVDDGRIDASQIGQRVILDQVDLVDEVDDSGNMTGRKVWKKRYVIVNMSMSNFFSPLTTMADYHKTILDRDYRITRKGLPKAQRVEYVPFALDPYQVTVLRDDKAVVITYDLREPEIAALYADSGVARVDLLKIVNRRISDAYYNRYFDPRVEVSWKDMSPEDDDEAKKAAAAAANGPAAPPPPPAPTPQQQAGQVLTQAPTQGPAAEALAAMRDRVMGSAAAAPATEAVAEAAPAAPAEPAAPPAAPPAPAPAPAAPAPAPAAAPAPPLPQG
jgi:hypothetical protein